MTRGRPKGSKDKQPRVRRVLKPSKVVRVPVPLFNKVVNLINKWKTRNENKTKEVIKKNHRPF